MDPEDENEEVPEVAPDPEPTPPPRAPPPEPEPEPEQPPPAATAAAPGAPRRVLYEDPDETGPKRVLYEDPDEGAFTAFAREIAHGVGPAAGGAILGAGTGAVAGAFTANPIGIGAAAIGGAIAGGYGVDVAQEAGLRALGAPEDAAIRRANEAAHPWATYGGKFLSNAAGGAAGFGRAAISGGARLLGGGIGAAWETGVAINEKKSFKEALPGVLSSAAGGATFAGERPWTRGAQRAAVAARPYYTRPPPPPPPPAPPPPVTQPGVRNRDWTGPPQDVPQATGFQQGQLPGIGDVQPSLPGMESQPPPMPGQQPRLPGEHEPGLPFERSTIDAEGQYGFDITAPDPRNASRNGMPPTSGVSGTPAPPAAGVQPRSNTGYAKEGSFPEARPWANEREERPHSVVGQGIMAAADEVPPRAASGINVIQAGQIDPDLALAHGSIPRTKVEPNAPQRPPPGPPGPPQPPRAPAPPIERRGVQNPDWQGPPAPIPRNQQVMVRPPDTTQGVLVEPPVRPDRVRLYRTDPQAPRAFTTDRAAAQQFGPLRHVDVNRGELAAQFRPGRDQGSYVAHPIWEHPAYQRRVQPTMQPRTQPTQRRWPPPESPHGPPPPPAPPPRGGGPGPAGQPPGGPRMADPRLDAAVARAVGAPPSGGTPRGPRRAAPATPAPSQPFASRGLPQYSREQANALVNRRDVLNREAAIQGMTPEALRAKAMEIVRSHESQPAPPPAPKRPINLPDDAANYQSAPPWAQPDPNPPQAAKVDKVEASVQRSRKKSDKVNAREAAREAASPQPPRGRGKVDVEARKAKNDEFSKWLDEEAKKPGSKAEEFRKLADKEVEVSRDGMSKEEWNRRNELLDDLNAEFEQRKPAAKPAEVDHAALAQARHEAAGKLQEEARAIPEYKTKGKGKNIGEMFPEEFDEFSSKNPTHPGIEKRYEREDTPGTWEQRVRDAYDERKHDLAAMVAARAEPQFKEYHDLQAKPNKTRAEFDRLNALHDQISARADEIANEKPIAKSRKAKAEPAAPPREKPPRETAPKKFGVAPELAEAAIATSKAKAAAGIKPADAGPRSLLQHIQKLGGIKPDDKGELAAAFGGKKSGMYLAIARKNGIPLDRVVENVARGAPEERYLHEGAGIRDLLDALKGSRDHYPAGEEAHVPKSKQERYAEENRAYNDKQVDEFLADPKRDLADFKEGDRQRMYDLMDTGDYADPAAAYKKLVEERGAGKEPDTRAQIEKDIDAWVESPDHDYYDPGMRDRMVELLEKGDAKDPADAHAKAVEEWDVKQREFEGDIGPPKEITPPPEKSVDNKLQEVIPGAGKDMKTAAQRAADAPLKPTQAQKGSDFGMFADKQNDMFDAPPKPKEEPKAAANEVPEGFKVFERDGKWITESIEGRWEIASKTQAEAIKEAHDTVKSLEKLKGGKPARASAIEAAAEKHGGLAKATEALEGRLAERVKAIEEGTAKPASFPGAQRLAMTRKDMDATRAAAKNNKPQVIATDKFGNEAKFTGATVHEAAVFARAAGYKPDQIKLLSGAPYVPPKAAAPAAPTPPAAAPPAGGGRPPPPAAPPPAGGTPTPPPQGPAGSVEAARASILSHVAKEVPWYKKIPTSKAEAKALWRTFYTQAKNAMDPFDQARKTIERETGQRLSEADDFAQLARLTKGLGGRFKQLMQYGTYDIDTGKVNGKGLDEVLKPVNDDPNGFTAYAMSKRVIELEGRGIKTGMNLAEANQVAAADAAKFEPVFRDLHAFQDRVLQNMVRSGILSDAAAAKMRQMNKEYVPFYRMLDPSSELGQQLGSGLQTRNPIFRIKGSDKDVFDPITSIIKNTYVFTDLAHRNQVITAMKRANDLMPADKQFMVRDRSSHPIEVQPQEIQKFLDAHGIEGFADDAMTIFRPNAFRPADDKIRLYNNGKAEVYTVPKDIGTAVNALDSQSMGLFLKIAATPASLLRAGAVFSPEFIVRNPLRDLLSAFIQAKHGSIPVYDFAIGLTHILKKSKDFQEWMIAGGANANLVSMDRAMLHTDPMTLRVANKVVNPRQWLKMLQDVSELSENATRMGVYSRARGKGISQGESAFSSREATLDFARLGASPVARALNSTIPFFNAQVEGVDQAARAFRDNKLGFLTKAGVGITLPSVLLWFKNQGDERVKELPAWQKDLFWIVPGADKWVPMSGQDAARWEGKDLSKLTHTVRQGPNGLERNDATIWRVPKPFEVGVLFGSVPERLLDAYYDHNPNAFKNLGSTMMQALTPSVVPQAVLPVGEQWANKSLFLDRSLLTEEQKKKSPSQQYGPYTSETAKAIGSVVRTVAGEKTSFGSPIMIDNYIRQWTGGLGKHVVDLIDMGIKSQQDRPPEPSKGLADMPGIKAFVARFPSQSAQSIQDFYDTRTDRKMNAADIKALQKTDPAGAAERRSKSDTYTGDTFAKQLKADRDAIKRIAADKNMSPDDKRAAMDLTYLLMIEHAKAGNAAFERNKRRAP